MKKNCGTILAFCVFVSLVPPAVAQVEPNDVLILVNDNSPTSQYIARLYREYYPDIIESQVLHLSEPNLVDCSGPDSTAADEIITRPVYEIAIAKPVRDYLISQGLVDQIKVIITTAGLPYRIEDTTFANIVRPADGSAYAASLIGSVKAASVESELTVLFQTDPNSPFDYLDYWDRTVNPYQGYRNSPIGLFDRDIIANLQNMDWKYPRKLTVSHYPPMMEGAVRGRRGGVEDRHFSVGDMYLTCRLDGPKVQGQSAVFAVRKMLENASLASDPAYGINEADAVVVLDDAPWAENFNDNRIYNLDRYVDFIVYEEGQQQPPDTFYPEYRDDYHSCFEQMTGQTIGYDILNVAPMIQAYDITVLCDMQNEHRINQADLLANEVAVAVASFGTNGDEGTSKDYILKDGPNDGPLFNLAYGAVFCSIESFNAVTMFSGASTTNQGSIIDFLEIGGCGAIGHVFEPYSDAVIDVEFLFYNLLADSDEDGFADMSFIEAAFTAIPYLSWAEVTIGDPLMRIAYGPGGQAIAANPADIDRDGQTGTIEDMAVWVNSYLGSLNDTGGSFDDYSDLCDLNQDGEVNLIDFALFAEFFH